MIKGTLPFIMKRSPLYRSFCWSSFDFGLLVINLFSPTRGVPFDLGFLKPFEALSALRFRENPEGMFSNKGGTHEEFANLKIPHCS